MKGKILIIFIGILLLLIITGGYFFYHALSKEEISENGETPIVENPVNNKNVKSNHSTSSNNSNQPTNNQATNNAPNNNSKNVVKNSNTKQPVVDQTLHSTKTKAENGKNITSVAKEKVDLEILLFDNDEDKVLANYEVNIGYGLGFATFKTEKFKTDSNGKIVLSVAQAGSMNLKIITKDYGSHYINLSLIKGHNEYKANLHKGGTLEIKATNNEDKTVEGLTLKMMNGTKFSPRETFVFDSSRGIYVLSNMPVGTVNLSFRAPGYQETSAYMTRIDSKNVGLLEVKLEPARTIYFDLNINSKPDLIYVYKDIISFKKNKESEEAESPEVFKNKNNLYEYSLDDLRFKSLTVKVDKYLPQNVTLDSDKDTYKITLLEGHTGELQINNEEGKPVMGANVSYSLRTNVPLPPELQNQTVSDNNGKAILTDLSEKMLIRLIVSHKHYVAFNEDWSFEAKGQNSKTINLKLGQGISGKVKFEGKPVMGAKVVLYPNGSIKPLISLESESDGSFYFNNFAGMGSSEYFIRAFHRDYGYARSITLKFENTKQVVDLNLAPEKSLILKLVDATGADFPNKKITISNNNGDANDAFAVITNEKGVCELFNLTHGAYTISLDDENLTVSNKDIQIPAGVIVVKTSAKKIKKLIVTTPGGALFKGVLQIKNAALKIINTNKGKDGFFYVEFPKELGNFLLEAQGYPIVILGSYDELLQMPSELAFELKESESFKVKVIGNLDLRPVKYVSVRISTGNTIIQTKSTNELGEIIFSHLNGHIFLSITANSYAPYFSAFDLSQTKDVIITLIKGGGLKGHLTFGKDVIGGYVFIQPNFPHSIQIGADGNFSVSDMTPGEYSISFKENYKDGKNVLTKIPSNIVIEAEKVFEINFDDYKKEKE